MNIIVSIPDDLAASLSADGTDLTRRALEAFAIEAYRTGRLTTAEVGRLLGLETCDALDGFLKAHGEYEDYTMADRERELDVLRKLGF